jgi:ribosomal protein S18 acetylase RimI-like enzyme
LDALKRSLEATGQVASVAVVVEAIDENAVRFYQKYGFRQFKEHPFKLYLPMKSIAESLPKS